MPPMCCSLFMICRFQKALRPKEPELGLRDPVADDSRMHLHLLFVAGTRLMPDRRRIPLGCDGRNCRSEEHTSELQSLMRISYAVFCLKKTPINTLDEHTTIQFDQPQYIRS